MPILIINLFIFVRQGDQNKKINLKFEKLEKGLNIIL